MNEYLTLKSNHGRIDIRITTNDNAVRIKGRLQSSEEGVDNEDVDKSFQLDDPDLNTKVGNIWNQFKTALNGLATHAIAEMESQYTDYVSQL